jgi:hypothetical protein
MQWMENTFFDHLDKFSNSLGYENFGIVFSLSSIEWKTTEERDNFIFLITGKDVQDLNPDNS